MAKNKNNKEVQKNSNKNQNNEEFTNIISSENQNHNTKKQSMGQNTKR